MSQRSIRSRVVFVAGAAIATGLGFVAACGTDDRVPPVLDESDDPLTPDPTGEQPSNGGGAALPGGGPMGMGGAAGSSSAQPGSGGSESQTGELPLAGQGGESGATSSPDEPPPPSTGLAPNCAEPEGDVPPLQLALVADGLAEPVFVGAAPGDDSRLFNVEKRGTVRVLLDGTLQEQPFVDVSSQVANQGERGLLGLAFHPDYANNGLFYLHFSSNGSQGIATGTGVVAEFAVDANDRNRANPESQRQVLLVNQPEANHNGGMLSFGRDGLLYLGFGDGGGFNDQHGAIGNGQALDTLLGKLLRIDVNGRDVNGAYSIPAGNLAEVTGQQALPEIWAYGLRNPWRFSFDACTGDLYIGDVGQNALEEIDFVPANTPAGANFGWRIMEASQCGPQGPNCNPDGLVLPVDEYPRDIGRSVTGGYVYRGSAIPGLRGHYLYADFEVNRIIRFRLQNGQIADRVDITNQLTAGPQAPSIEIASFGQDNAGEVYVAAFNPDAVYRIVAAQ